MNESTRSTVEYLNFITRELNRYIPLTFLILGSLGNLLNIIIFNRPTTRKHPCSIYFIGGSIINFISLYVGLITPFLGLYNLDVTQVYHSLCKIRFYFRYSTITLSTWCILLACIDRYMGTSIHNYIRWRSTLHLARRNLLVVSIVCFTLPYTQVFYCYSINLQGVCIHINTTCKLLNDIILLLLNSGLPPVLMLVLTMLTIRNVKRTNFRTRNYQRDMNLIRILFVYVAVFILFSIPVALQKIYTDSTAFKQKSELERAVDNLLNQISIEISYISNSTTFYIYTLANKTYRKEARNILLSIIRCQFKQRVHPNVQIQSQLGTT